MDSRKSKSFAVTIRPKAGISDEDILTYQKWVSKKTTYSYTVTEKDHNERHIHSAIFFDDGDRIDNIKRSLVSLFKFTGNEKYHAICIKTMYNHDWLSYVNKGDSTVVIHSNLPEEHLIDSYFAVPEERASKITTKLSFYGKLEKLWFEKQSAGVSINPHSCRDFLFRLMYSERIIEPLKDDRTIIQVSRHLSRYLLKMEHSCLDVSIYERDE